MADFALDSLVLGPVQTNTYFLWNEDTKDCLIIDPSDGIDEIEELIADRKIKPAAVYLTHGHDDHIGSVNELKRRYGILVYMMKEEGEFSESVQYNLSMMFGHPRVIEPDMFFIDGQRVPVIGTYMTAMLTPGHTPGGGCYYFPDQKIVFTGDTLFRGSVGRSDFPGGNGFELIRSVKTRLMELPDDTAVLPGHGPSSSIGYEREHNPYLQ